MAYMLFLKLHSVVILRPKPLSANRKTHLGPISHDIAMHNDVVVGLFLLCITMQNYNITVLPENSLKLYT